MDNDLMETEEEFPSQPPLGLTEKSKLSFHKFNIVY